MDSVGSTPASHSHVIKKILKEELVEIMFSGFFYIQNYNSIAFISALPKREKKKQFKST